MASQFSKDGKYFAQLTTEGKLKIWEIASNRLEQEYIPDYHLTSPFTCLHFVNFKTANKSGIPRKKQRRSSQDFSSYYIVLGTSSSLLLVYSISKGDIEFKIDSETNQSITCLSCYNDVIFSGAEQNIVSWNLYTKTVISKWKAGNDKISAILVVPNSDRLLTASKNIKVWNYKTREILRTFTGHSHEVTLLHYINPKENEDEYFISGSNGDRLLNCWNLNGDKNAIMNFLMEDIVCNVSIIENESNATGIAAVTNSGIVHIYWHTFNGKCNKPLKPKTTVQVVSDSTQNETVEPIFIFGAVLQDALTITIVYGNAMLLTFENVILNEHEKVHCIIRKDPVKSIKTKENEKAKVRTPVVDSSVHYVTTRMSNATTVKRKGDGSLEVPMETRLENLTLKKPDNVKVPRADNVAQLLVQGLHSKDQTILDSVLHKRDESVIRNTVKRLRMTDIVLLIKELTKSVDGKTLSCLISSIWLKYIIQIHSGILLSNPDLSDLIGSLVGSIETRLSLHMPLNKLRGRLNLIVTQMVTTPLQEEENEQALLLFDDKEISSDSEMEGIELPAHSDSDNEWVEEDSEVDKNNKESEDEMSS